MTKILDEECHIDNPSIIDNEHHILLDNLCTILPKTCKASIAVGYFFISGFAEIMNSLTKIEQSSNDDYVIRLLISPVTNRATAEALIAGNESISSVKERTLGKDNNEEENFKTVKDQIKKSLEHMPQTTKDREAAIKIKELIKTGKLQVKVYTKEELHAKAYIFELCDEITNRIAIIGSSNLSISGIKEHTELNLMTKHDKDTEGLLQWFDCHWNDKTCKEFTMDIAKIIDKSWTAGNHRPVDVYNKAILHEHKDRFDELAIGNIDKPVNGKKLFEFQKFAVADAIKKLDEFGGVMISDVVGTGKTLIGTVILKYLINNNNSKPLIICPPHLIDMWRDYMYDYNIHGDAISRYKIAIDYDLLRRYKNCDVILIDESHNFRNSNTNAYKALFAFMEEKTEEARIIMLSATPISNKLTDMKNQLALFPGDMLSRIPVLGTTELKEYFKGTTNIDGSITDEGAKKTRELLKYILIRRTRKQIKEKYAKYDKDKKLYYLESDGKRKYFPERNLKNPSEYDIDKVYNDKFEDIANTLSELNLARYNPGKYIKKEYLDPTHKQYEKYHELAQSSMPLVGIVRISLLKRVESSIQAFSDSVNNYSQGHTAFNRQLKKGIIPIGKDFHDAMYRSVTDPDYSIEQYEEDISKIQHEYDINAFDVTRWREDIDRDKDLFAKINGWLGKENNFTKYDDKLRILVDILKDMKNDKILIFSESASTARYIAQHLKTEKIQNEIHPRTIEQIDSKIKKDKGEILWRFDPTNNPKRKSTFKGSEIDILISTDILAEGVNLQAGRVVINYDFHWNPVRLIQRIGRVDRIGSTHDRIEIINFLPTTKGELHLNLKGKVRTKIELIRKIIGSDQKILESAEVFDSSAMYDIYEGNERIMDSEDSVLDMVDSQSETDADAIKKDKKKLAHVKALPFGIRSSVGNERLLIACEAQEMTVNEKNQHEIMKRVYRKHYEVSPDGDIHHIWASTFLEHMGQSVKNNPTVEDPIYNELVKKAWSEFNRDIKFSSVATKQLKHQKYFTYKIKGMPKSIKTDKRIPQLIEFLGRRMLPNYQPYKSLAELRDEIDRDPNADNKKILDELDRIYQEYQSVKYTKKINKPKILYSMMMRK